MEHREESININEEQKEAEEQSEYLAELEQLFGVDKGHMPTIWEQPQDPLISDPGTGCSVPGAYNPHQTFCTECMDVIQDAHHVMWCDTAKPRHCSSATVITVGSENGPRRDVSDDLSPDIPSEIVGALELDGMLPERTTDKEREPFSRQDPASDSPGAAQEGTSIPPPPPEPTLAALAWCKTVPNGIPSFTAATAEVVGSINFDGSEAEQANVVSGTKQASFKSYAILLYNPTGETTRNSEWARRVTPTPEALSDRSTTSTKGIGEPWQGLFLHPPFTLVEPMGACSDNGQNHGYGTAATLAHCQERAPPLFLFVVKQTGNCPTSASGPACNARPIQQKQLYAMLQSRSSSSMSCLKYVVRTPRTRYIPLWIGT